jgi:hypothetical protein
VQPQNTNQCGQKDSTHWVNPPAQLTATNGGQDTKAVDEKVVAVILPQNANLGDLIPQSPAVQEQGKFCGKGNRNRNDRGKMERLRLFLGANGQFTDRERNENE